MLTVLKDADGRVWTGRLRMVDVRRVKEQVKVQVGRLPTDLQPFDLLDSNQIQHFHLNPGTRLEILTAWLQPEWQAKGLTVDAFQDLWDGESVVAAMDFLEQRIAAFLSPPAQNVRRTMIAGMLEQISQPHLLQKLLNEAGNTGSSGLRESLASERTPKN